MIQLSLPIRVTPASCAVPQLKLQYSRMVLRSPISSAVGSPPCFLSWGGPQRAEPEDAVPRADAGSPFDHDVRTDRGPLPDLDVLADDRIRAHGNAPGELRPGVDHRARVDHIERSVHRIFASAA